MICYLEGKRIDLNTTRRNCLGSGVEGAVYVYDNQAIKIYHDYVITERREVKDKIYQGLTTKRIITPDEIVTDSSDRYIGYSQEIVKKPRLFGPTVVDANRDTVIKNFRLLEEDSLTFARNFVFMFDVEHNIIDNGTLYFFDTGCYQILTKDTISENKSCLSMIGIEEDETVTKEKLEYRLKIKNLDTCYVTIWNNLEKHLRFDRKGLRNLKEKVIEELDQTDENSRLSTILNNYMKPDDTIRTLVKRMR